MRGLTTLEKRRSIGNLMEGTIRLVLEGVTYTKQCERLSEVAQNKTNRGYRYTLCKKAIGTLGKIFFRAGAVDLWNGLDQGSPNYGPRAGSGPPRSPIRPAVPFPKI